MPHTSRPPILTELVDDDGEVVVSSSEESDDDDEYMRGRLPSVQDDIASATLRRTKHFR